MSYAVTLFLYACSAVWFLPQKSGLIRLVELALAMFALLAALWCSFNVWGLV